MVVGPKTKQEALAILSVLSLSIIALHMDPLHAISLYWYFLQKNVDRKKKEPASTVSHGVRHSESQVSFNGKRRPS